MTPIVCGVPQNETLRKLKCRTFLDGLYNISLRKPSHIYRAANITTGMSQHYRRKSPKRLPVKLLPALIVEARVSEEVGSKLLNEYY